MSLKTKFLNVMKSCAYVQKMGENTFHRYKYATAADVFEKVNAALVEQGIISIAKPVIVSSEPVTTVKGNIESRVTVEMTVTLMDSATGETMTLTAFGSGQDTGDKAVMKAQTAALKYCYMMSLNISTGDDPEADAGVDVRAASLAQAGVQARQANPPAVVQAVMLDAQRAPVAAATAAAQDVVPPSEPLLSPQVIPTANAAVPQSDQQRQLSQTITQEQLKIIFVLGRRAGIADEFMRDRIYRTYSVTSSRQLTKEQAAALIKELQAEMRTQAAG